MTKLATGKNRWWQVTGQQLAEAFGVTDRRVRQMREEGLPALPNGKYDIRVAFQWRFDGLEAESGSGDSPSLERWRTAKAAREELALARERGALIDAEAQRELDTRNCLSIRHGLMTLQRRLDALVTPEAANAVEDLIQELCAAWIGCDGEPVTAAEVEA